MRIARIQVYVDPDKKNDLKRYSSEIGISMNSIMNYLLIDFLELIKQAEKCNEYYEKREEQEIDHAK